MATVGDISTIKKSGDLFTDALLNNAPSWNYLAPSNGNILYYTFSNDGSHDSSVSSLSVFNATQIASTRSALTYVESITGIDFVETTNLGLVQFSFINGNLLSGTDISGTSFSSWRWGPDSNPSSTLTSFSATTEIVLDIFEFPDNTNPVAGNESFETLLHEIGHSLGLKHPFAGATQLPANVDNTNNTIMSYTHAGASKSTFQEYDLNALWWIYGGDGLGGQFGINSTNGPSLRETTAPTITTFSPTDEASGVAVGSNIVVTFNEAIARGTGNIVLKTSAGTVVATYDAATSGNIAITGSTLTLNPTADLTAGTGYTIEFAAGSVKDLAGNNFAGTTSYNFTTAAATTTPPPTTTTKDAQFLVLQPSSPAIVGAGIGDDTYLISGSMLPANKSVTLSDASGTNSIQIAAGLSIASSQVTATAVKLTLSNGAAVTILGADKFTYEIGGNSTSGQNDADTSYQNFIQGTLGVTVASSGIVTGGALVIDNITPASLLVSTTSGNDFVIPQFASPAIVGAGNGDDTYLISGSMLPAGTSLTISDATGSNSIQLAPGLSITGSQVAVSALKLTLDTGATVTILGANNFTYDVGGNTTAGIDHADVSYATLVQNTLKTTVPSSGITLGGAVIIGDGSSSGLTGTTVQGNNTVNATAASDVFTFDAVIALLDTAGTNTQASINGFSTSADKLQINLPTANAAITTLSQLNGQQNVVVQSDPFTGSTLISFGNDANGGQTVTLTLVGVTDSGLVGVQVV